MLRPTRSSPLGTLNDVSPDIRLTTDRTSTTAAFQKRNPKLAMLLQVLCNAGQPSDSGLSPLHFGLPSGLDHPGAKSSDMQVRQVIQRKSFCVSPIKAHAADREGDGHEWSFLSPTVRLRNIAIDERCEIPMDSKVRNGRRCGLRWVGSVSHGRADIH